MRGSETIVAGKYRLLEPLATGGMGALWLAQHVFLKTLVVVKRPLDWQGGSQAVDRFQREARAAASLRSRHIVRVQDFGLDDGYPYLVMELLQGEDLGDRIARGPLDPSEAGEWLEQMCRALRLAHAAGIVHRDIKPSNLFIANEDGERILKVLDFGIAKQLWTSQGTQTQSRTLLGSPGYMSPEQARGLSVDPRSDLWSVAVVLYEMITAHAPFSSEHPGDSIARVCAGVFPRPSSLVPSLPASLDAFFERALASDPERRFSDADALSRAYQDVLRGVGPVRDSDAGQTAVRSEPRISTVSLENRGPSGPEGRGRDSTTRVLAANATADGVTVTPVRSKRRGRALVRIATALVLLGATFGLLFYGKSAPDENGETDEARSSLSERTISADGEPTLHPSLPQVSTHELAPAPPIEVEGEEAFPLAPSASSALTRARTPAAAVPRRAHRPPPPERSTAARTEAEAPALAVSPGVRRDPFTGLPLEGGE